MLDTSATRPDPDVRASLPNGGGGDPCRGETVYFGGSCPLCRREIAVYRARTGPEVAFVDVSMVPDGRVAADLTRDVAMSRFHVRAADGRLLSGAAAFAELWQRTPGFRLAGRIASWPVVLPLLEIGYRASLVVRPWLQKLARRWENDGRPGQGQDSV